jgi:uncharacterized protein (TIGR00369 family)
MSDTLRGPAMADGFVPVAQEGTFIGHIGGLHWKRLADRVETRLFLERKHTNPIGTAHGGLLMTMLDITLGATAQAFIGHHGEGHPATIQVSCSLIAAAREGELLCGEASVDSATRTMSFVSGRLHVAGKTILTGSAVFRNPPPSDAPSQVRTR